MWSFDALPKRVKQDIEDYVKENDIGFLPTTKEVALQYFLHWNGIQGYTDTILKILEET